MWGLLFAYSASNLDLEGAAWNFSAADRPSACAAAAELQRHAGALVHNAQSTQPLDATKGSRLPTALTTALATQRVWPEDAFLDLAQSDEVISDRPAAHICALRLADLSDVCTRVCASWCS